MKNRVENTLSKYLLVQEKCQKLLANKKLKLNSAGLMKEFNISSTAMQCMLSYCCIKEKYRKANGRTCVAYRWNKRIVPSETVSDLMHRAMMSNSIKYSPRKLNSTPVVRNAYKSNTRTKNIALEDQQKNNIEQQVAQLKKSVDGMRPLFINVRDNISNAVAINSNKIENLQHKISNTKPTILSRFKSHWQSRPATRYFVYYITGYIVVSLTIYAIWAE